MNDIFCYTSSFKIFLGKDIFPFANPKLKNRPNFSIARWSPKSYQGKSILEFAPSDELFKKYKNDFKFTWKNYIEGFFDEVQKQDIKKLINKIPQGSVLLCWCPPGFCCHRRIVAEIIENHTGLEVPEYGCSRDFIPESKDLHDAADGDLVYQEKCSQCKKLNSIVFYQQQFLCKKCRHSNQVVWLTDKNAK
jgi:hypothetical protein